MNSIENYKKRFNMLMESSLGDVRPLINEVYQAPETNNIPFKVKDATAFTSLLTPANPTLSYSNETSMKYLNPNYASLIWAACGLNGIVYNFTIDTTIEEVNKFINRGIATAKTNLQTLSKIQMIGNDGTVGMNPTFVQYFNKTSNKNPIPNSQPPKSYTDWQVFLNKYIIPYRQQKEALIEKTPTQPGTTQPKKP